MIEHSWCAPYLEQLSPVCTRTVLDLHNVESVLHARCAADRRPRQRRCPSRLPRRLARNWSAPGCRAFRWCSPPRRPMPSSPAPSRPGPRSRSTRTRCPPTPRPPAGDEEAIVFSGNMEYHPNLTAVRFFRREIWPRLRDRWPRLVWRLVGKNPAAVQRFTARRSANRSGWPGAGRRLRTRPLAGRGSTIACRKRHPPEDSGGLGGRTAGGFHHIGRRRPAGARRGELSCSPTARSLSPRAVTRLLACTELRHRIGDGWQIVAGEGVYMGNCLEKVRLMTQPSVISGPLYW